MTISHSPAIYGKAPIINIAVIFFCTVIYLFLCLLIFVEINFMSVTCHFIELPSWTPKQITLALRDIPGLEHTGIYRDIQFNILLFSKF